MTMLEIILIILLSVLIVAGLVIIILNLKKTPQNDITSQQQALISQLELLKKEITHELELLNQKDKSDIKEELNLFKETITQKVTKDMTDINDKVTKRLQDGFKDSQDLFSNIKERLAIIDTTQKGLEKLATDIGELSGLLADKKQRGLFGEAQLYHILDNVFGENNRILFDKQKKLSNGSMVDAIVYAPEGIGHIPVDSKFSLENYLIMIDANKGQDERNQATKNFKGNIRKHIDDIANKYIIQGETADQAIMFIPSEAVFSEIHANNPDLIEYAQKKKVWITSSTTLVYMLMMVLVIASNIEKEKNAEKIVKELENLYADFKRFFDRWLRVINTMKSVQKALDDMDITVNKLNNKVYKIEQSSFD